MTKLANFYNSNTVFHSFVQGALAAIVAALASWPGGMPTSKMGWWALGAFIGKALFSWFTRWAQTRENVVPVQITANAKPAPPNQAAG